MKSLPSKCRGAKLLLGKLKRDWIYTELEISVRYNVAELLPTVFCQSEIAYDYLLKIWDMDTIEVQEDMVALFLNHRLQLIGHRKISRGNGHSTILYDKLICAVALHCLASFVILAHNHPSKNLNPSRADIHHTIQLNSSLAMFDIGLLDYLIISRDGFRCIHLPSSAASGQYKQNELPSSVY